MTNPLKTLDNSLQEQGGGGMKELCQQVYIYNEEAPITSHISCAQVAILLLHSFVHFCTFCATVIYDIYIFIFACLLNIRNTMNLSCHV